MSNEYSGGKGDRQRPVVQALYDAGYDVAFAKTPAAKAAARKILKEVWAKHLGDKNAANRR